MVSSALALLALAFHGSNAFVPASTTQKQAILKTTTVPFHKRRDFSVSNDKLLAEPIEPHDDMIAGQTVYEEPLAVSESIEEAGFQYDQGAELVLDTLSKTKPEDLFDVSDHVGSIFSDDSSLDEPETQEEPVEVKQGGNALSGTDYADFGNSTLLTEDVLAVLEASGAAAAEAEASMPPALIEQFEFPASSQNATTSSTPLVVEEIPEILSASSVVGEPMVSKKFDPPSVSKILKFAIPAIGVWLCGPLLSLIDTSAVGLFSGTVQQAALNPAVAVTDYAALLIAFMYTGTTNLVAAAQESDRTTAGSPVTTKTLIGAMQLSSYVGAGLGAFLFVFARPLLKAIIGNDGISPAVFGAAMKYVRIRALGMPAAAIIGSTQAACLGMQDIRSPLYVLVAAAVANFFGDIFFVGSTHPWIGGAAGAAWATVFSQYVGVALFVRWLSNKPQKKPSVMNLSNAILEMTGKPKTDNHNRRQQGLRDTLEKFQVRSQIRRPKMPKAVGKLFKNITPKRKSTKQHLPKEQNVSVRGFLQDKFSPSDLLKVPSKLTRKQFAPYLVPVTSTQIGRVSGYVAMSHVVASSLGTVSMAAQQVVVSLFYCLCPIADSLSLTAQSFLPSISEKKASKERTAALRKTVMNFMKAGGVFGGAMVAAVTAIPLFTGFFTADPVVVSMINSVVPLLMAFFAVHGVLCSAEGLLLGQKDLSFLGKMYAGYFFVVPYLMLRVKKAALAGSTSANLVSVWSVFVGYQLFRAAAWLARVAVLDRRTSATSEKAELASEQANLASEKEQVEFEELARYAP
eukprot:scaffold10476_cov142-Cylindrotheca_fusiformis.AAC.6